MTTGEVVLRQAVKLKPGDVLWRPYGKFDFVTQAPVIHGPLVTYVTDQGQDAGTLFRMVPVFKR
jgi:hypothetical protein